MCFVFFRTKKLETKSLFGSYFLKLVFFLFYVLKNKENNENIENVFDSKFFFFFFL